MSVNLTAGQLGLDGDPTPESLRALRLVTAPAVRPGGVEVVAVVQEIRGDRYLRRLWRWPVAGAAAAGRSGEVGVDTGPTPVDPRPDEEGSDTAPSWSPAGDRLAFLSDRGGVRHVRVAGPALDGSAALVLGKELGPVRRFTWLDDERLAVVADATPVQVPDPAVIDWLRYKRDGRTDPFDVPAVIVLAELGTDDGASAPAIASRTVVTAPGPVSAIAVAGTRLAYVTADGRSDAVVERNQLRLLDLATGIDRLCWDCPAPIDAIAAAGEHLVAVSRGAEPTYAARRAWRVDCSDLAGAPRRLFPELEASVDYSVTGDARATGAGRRVTVGADGTVRLVATVAGDHALLRGTVDGEAPVRISPEGSCVTDFAVAGDVEVCCLESPDVPGELHRLDGGDPASEPLSTLNASWVAATRPVRPANLAVTAADDIAMTAWLTVPDGSGPHPLLVRVHGGPHMCSGNGFSLETQLLVAAGIAVLAPNVRGSDGWGDALRAASVGEWGGADFSDLMATVDAALAAAPIDPERLYLAGGSYGGYLTNWAVTQTDRFRAAISERSVSNLLSKYGTSDNGFDTNRTEMGGADLFDDSAGRLLERSPLRHASQVTTPVLLIHGERDQRCPIEQSEQFFAALRRNGVETVLVRYPGESHDYTGGGTPVHRIDRLQRILDWLARHA